MECVFCEIVAGRVETDKVYESDDVLVIQDLNPVAPVHLLIFPRSHVAKLSAMDEENADLLSHVMLIAKRSAIELGLDKSGYRVVINEGAMGGQTVQHFHAHILGGRQMHWPPG
tara:strand:- start:44 stop:385 length:342 start_codon:yes stop_codon:yes gene_type:complete